MVQQTTKVLVLILLGVLLASCRPVTAAGGQAVTGAAQTPRGDGTGQGNRGDADDQRSDGAGARDGSEGQRSEGGEPGAKAQAAAPVTWDEAPACENEPHDLAAWRADFAAYDPDAPAGVHLDMLLDQMHRYTQVLPAYAVPEMARLLSLDPGTSDRESATEQMLAVLWLNLIDERLNRATALAAAGAEASAEAPQSVGELSDRLAAAPAEGAEWPALMALAAAVARGEQLGAQVCAQLIYRSGPDLHIVQWNEEGAAALVQELDAPAGYTTFSPDYTRLAIQTPRGDTAGGPLYLYTVATEATVNLNEESGLPIYSSISALKVVGWHPDNQRLLLANEDDEVTLWLDLQNQTYTPVVLGIDASKMAPPRSFLLSPDGSGFTFLTSDRETKATNLFWYDLAGSASRLLLTLPDDGGKLEGLQIAPDGEQAVFVLHKGSRRQGRSEELVLVDLQDGSSEVLLSGALGPVRPVWSPDSRRIAFVRRSMEQPIKAAPHAAPPLGDIWTLTIASGEMQQLTFTGALDRPPVWSPSGDLLAFVTSGGEIGLVGSTQPELIWRVESQVDQPQFTHIGFLP